MSWSAGTPIEVRIVTEDGSGDAHETLAHLVRRMSLLVEPTFATNRLKTLRQQDADERLAAQPHRWHSRDPRDRLFVTRLARSIAADLLAGRFVVVHADGDTTWSNRPSPHESSFRENLTPIVHEALAPERLQPRSPRRSAVALATRPDAEIRRYLSRLILIMPYYTLEAWLYQNTDVALRLCREKYQGQDLQKFLDWQNDRAKLDEESVESLRVCLAKKHNLELASSGYPAAAVHAANASFHAAASALRACVDLQTALAS